MNTDNRIRMALAMGWIWREDPPLWSDPKNKSRYVTTKERLPFDPENDANDCNAVIKHLNGLGYAADIAIKSSGDSVFISRVVGNCDVGYGIDSERWEGDNWMHGVATLALKVIDNDN